MIGDVLRKKINLLADVSENKKAPNALWIVLRDIAREEIIEYGRKVDSDIIIPIYYSIIVENQDILPAYFCERLVSNKQERFRVVIRNVFSSNAFHNDGLANMEGIVAYKEINKMKKGERIIFQKK